MASDIKGLTCMLIDGGEESLNVLERVCWYECDPQMFGGGAGMFGSKDKCWAGTSLNVYRIIDAVL